MNKKVIWIMIIVLIAAVVGLLIDFFLLSSGNFNFENCVRDCQRRGYENGQCEWPENVDHSYESIGPCLVKNSKHCGNEGQCECFCYDEQIIGGCGGVALEHVQECCGRIMGEPDIDCLGKWTVEAGRCKWECY